MYTLILNVEINHDNCVQQKKQLYNYRKIL